MKCIATIAALTVCLSVHSGSAEENKLKGYDDRPFTCGAVFRILMNNHVNDNDKKSYNKYKAIFDRLYERAKKNFTEAGGTEEEARQELQENINLIWKASSPGNPNIETIVSYCYKFGRK